MYSERELLRKMTEDGFNRLPDSKGLTQGHTGQSVTEPGQEGRCSDCLIQLIFYFARGLREVNYRTEVRNFRGSHPELL